MSAQEKDLAEFLPQVVESMTAEMRLQFLVREIAQETPVIVLKMLIILIDEDGDEKNAAQSALTVFPMNRVTVIDNTRDPIGYVLPEVKIDLRGFVDFYQGQTLYTALSTYVMYVFREENFPPRQQNMFVMRPGADPETFIALISSGRQKSDLPETVSQFMAPEVVRPHLLPTTGSRKGIPRAHLTSTKWEGLNRKEAALGDALRHFVYTVIEKMGIFQETPPHLEELEQKILDAIHGTYGNDQYEIDHDEVMLEFFTPLLFLSYQLITRVLLEFVRTQPVAKDADHIVVDQLLDLGALVEEYIHKEIDHLSIRSYKKNDVRRVFDVELPDKSSLDLKGLQTVLDWLKALLNPENWKGETPYYIHLNEASFPDLPRIVLSSRGEVVGFAHEFGGTLVMPRPLNSDQTRQMWNDLAMHYDDEGSQTNKVAWEYKKKVYEILITHCQLSEGHKHLELCCGAGNIKTSIDALHSDVSVVGFDISDEMVERAQSRGVDARRLNLNTEKMTLPNASIDTANISFGEMWLDSGHVFSEVFRVLKSGGRFTFNIYNTAPTHLHQLQQDLTNAGFDWEVKTEKFQLASETELVRNQQGFKEVLIVVARKP